LLVVVGVVLGSVCGSGKCHTNVRTVVDAVVAQSDLTNATKALYSTGLAHELCVFDCNYTIFAPTDTAFEPQNANDARIWNPPWILHLKGIVKNHIIEQRIESRDLTVGRTMTMLSRETVSVVHTDNGTIALMSVGTKVSNVTQTDYEADNGVVHVLDKLLWPSFMGMDVLGLINTNMSREYSFSILIDLLNQADMNESLSIGTNKELTLFAPTNAAFEALGDKIMSRLHSETDYRRQVISNHLTISVIPSVDIPAIWQPYSKLEGQNAHFSRTANGTLLVNDAKVLIADALASNGIVHVIDKVLLEPYSPMTSSATTFSWPIWALAIAMIVTQ
jgi:transforming growth factor-beta-induced protein